MGKNRESLAGFVCVPDFVPDPAPEFGLEIGFWEKAKLLRVAINAATKKSFRELFINTISSYRLLLAGGLAPVGLTIAFAPEAVKVVGSPVRLSFG